MAVPRLELTYRIVPEFSAGGRRMDLTGIEGRILAFLFERTGTISSAEEILQFAWPGERVQVHTLHTHLSSLRRKLSITGWAIRNVRGRGYELVAADEPDELDATGKSPSRGRRVTRFR